MNVKTVAVIGAGIMGRRIAHVAALGEKYRPCPLMVQYVKAGRLGKKVGKGVYEYRS